jgi:hypothetical protein
MSFKRSACDSLHSIACNVPCVLDLYARIRFRRFAALFQVLDFLRKRLPELVNGVLKLAHVTGCLSCSTFRALHV